MDEQCATEVLPQCLKHLGGHVEALFFSEVNACERRLHRVDQILSLQLFEESDPGCCGLVFLDAEPTVIEGEVGVQLAQHEWKDSAYIWVLRPVAAIHEYVVFTTVPVQVTKHSEASFRLYLLN